jgi:hypothetical protein
MPNNVNKIRVIPNAAGTEVNHGNTTTTTSSNNSTKGWSKNAPSRFEDMLLTIICGNSNFHWALHLGFDHKFVPTLFWKLSLCVWFLKKINTNGLLIQFHFAAMDMEVCCGCFCLLLLLCVLPAPFYSRQLPCLFPLPTPTSHTPLLLPFS